MRELFIHELVPGMILCEDIYNFAKQKVVTKGTVLTDEIITRLEYYSVLRVKVKLGESSYQNEQHESKIIKTEEYKQYKKYFERFVDRFSIVINDIIEKNAPLDEKRLYENVEHLFQFAKSNVFELMRNMEDFDDNTFSHSINVSLICDMMANWMEMDEKDHRIAVLSGLLHDVGKLKVPSNVIKKPAKLTKEEYEIVKLHTKEGFELLSQYSVDKHIKKAALEHHERCDGSGYPLGLKENEIDRFAKIVSIADVYDAMTSSRIYRGPMCPFDVIEIFEEEGLHLYDIKLASLFLRRVAESYIGEEVCLTNGAIGQIIIIKPQRLSRPVVKCKNQIYDLTQNHTLKIQRIL